MKNINSPHNKSRMNWAEASDEPKGNSNASNATGDASSSSGAPGSQKRETLQEKAAKIRAEREKEKNASQNISSPSDSSRRNYNSNNNNIRPRTSTNHSAGKHSSNHSQESNFKWNNSLFAGIAKPGTKHEISAPSSPMPRQQGQKNPSMFAVGMESATTNVQKPGRINNNNISNNDASGDGQRIADLEKEVMLYKRQVEELREKLVEAGKRSVMLENALEKSKKDYSSLDRVRESLARNLNM